MDNLSPLDGLRALLQGEQHHYSLHASPFISHPPASCCFGPLKQAYGRQIEKKMRAGTSHITKEDFFPAFLAAFQEAMTEKNVQGGFRGAGLVPFDPASVISWLDVKPRTPTPVEGVPETPAAWVSKTPQTTRLKQALNRISSKAESPVTRIARRRRFMKLLTSSRRGRGESCIRSPFSRLRTAAFEGRMRHSAGDAGLKDPPPTRREHDSG